MKWLIPAVIVINITLAFAIEKALVIRFTENYSFNFNRDFLKRFYNCLCDGKNTKCTVSGMPPYDIKSEQGSRNRTEKQITAYYQCQFTVLKELNITCRRALSKPMCSSSDCSSMCFTDTSSCDFTSVTSVFTFQRSVTVDINDQRMHHDSCPQVTAGDTANAHSWHNNKCSSLHSLTTSQLFVPCITDGNSVVERQFNMALFVRSLQTYALDLTQQKTLGDVKTLVSDNEHLPMEQMAVFYESQPLEDECQLASFRDESTLNVELRFLGRMYMAC